MLSTSDLLEVVAEGSGTGTSYNMRLYRARDGALRLRIERHSAWQGSSPLTVTTYPWSADDSQAISQAVDDATDAGGRPSDAAASALYERAVQIEHDQVGRIVRHTPPSR